MEILNNLGICYIGDYINQGSQFDKCRKSNQLGIKNTEFLVRNDGKNMDFENVSNDYNGNILFHLPSINVNQSNLKEIKDSLNLLLKNNIKLITIDASTLLYDTFEWCTKEEQQNYLRNMASSIASICTSNIKVAIENTNLDKNAEIFGKTISNISDLLMYTRNILIEQYDYSREKANDSVGISINLYNLIKTNEIVDLENWFKVFNKDILCIKVRKIDTIIPMFNQLLDLVIKYEIDVPILLETKEELENIVNDYKKFEYLVKCKVDGKSLDLSNYKDINNTKYNDYNYNFNSMQSGYTNIVIICIILLTTIIAVLMFMLKLG